MTEQPEPPEEEDKDDVTSSDEESSNGKNESSSVPRAVPRGILAEPKTRFSSPPLTSLIRGSPEPKTRVSRPDPPESFSLLYKKTQERSGRLIQSVNERIAQQNKYMEQMTTFLHDSKQQAETQMDKMQDNFLGQINRIIANSHMRVDLQEEKRAESDRKWRESLALSKARQDEMEKRHKRERQAQAMRAQQREGDEGRARSIERLTKEVSILEQRQQKRWEELVYANTWDSYEKDKEALQIDTKLQETRDLIQSLFDEMPSTRDNTAESKERGSNLQPQCDEILIMAPRPGSERGCDEILIRVKRGENQAHVKHLPNGPEGYVDLAISIHHLIEDKRSRESSSAEPKSSSEPKYLGYRSNQKGREEQSKDAKEQSNKRRRLEDQEKSKGKEEKVERFQIGDRVYFFNDEPGNEKWHEARVIGHLYPGDDSYPTGQRQVSYRIQPVGEKGQKYQPTIRKENSLRAWDWGKPCLVAKVENDNQPLLPLDRVGTDTCSALSVSS